MVSGELVRQPSRTRSLEEEGSRLRRQLADAQRDARHVAVVVNERLNRPLPHSGEVCRAAEIRSGPRHLAGGTLARTT